MSRANALLQKVRRLIPVAWSPSSSSVGAVGIHTGKRSHLHQPRERCRWPYTIDCESDDDMSAYTTNPAYAQSRDSSDLPPSHSPQTHPKVTRSPMVGERLGVSFNPHVVAITAEDQTRFIFTALCSNGKDTRSRLRILTHVEKHHLYQVREDLQPPGYRCPLKENMVAARTFSGSSGRTRDSLDRQLKENLQASSSLAGRIDFNVDTDYDSDDDSDFSMTFRAPFRNSLDFRQMRSSSLDLEEGWVPDDLSIYEDEGLLSGSV